MNDVAFSMSDARAAIGASAITPDKPAGADCRSSPQFEALEAEVRKIETGGPKSVDWPLALRQSLAILSDQSKDFLVGSWAAYALYRCEGANGLHLGFSILGGMVDAHWDAAFPPPRRERARVGCFDWLINRAAAAVNEVKYGDEDAPALASLFEVATQFEDAVGARLQSESFSAAELTRLLRPAVEQMRRLAAEAKQRAESEAAAAAARESQPSAQTAAPPPSPSTAANAPPLTAPPAQAPGANASLPEIEAALDGLSPILRAQSEGLAASRPEDPRAFLLRRMASWLRLGGMPAEQNGRTPVVAPVAALEAIEAARAAANWPAALAASEELIWAAPFCVDAQRLSYESLGEMGTAFGAARDTALGLLRYFAQRFAAAMSLAFSDGRPYADEATRALANAGQGGGEARDEMTAAIGVARALMTAGKAAEAMEALSAPLRAPASGRRRMVWQLAQVRFCLQHGFIVATLPLIEYLDQMVSARDLEVWEPELATSVAELRMLALTHADSRLALSDERRRNALDEARGRIARLDLAAAVRLLRA